MHVGQKQLPITLVLTTPIFERKFYTEFDVFYRLKSKMLATRIHSLPSTFGAVLPQENINEQDTRGFELMLGHANKIGKLVTT